MEQYFKKSLFERVMMTGVFVGIFITLATLFYDLLFVESTGFPLSEIINIASLIFAVNLLFLVIGPVYYGFLKLTRFGDVLFIVVFILLTIFLLLMVRGIDRTDNVKLNIEFRRLLSGIIIIAGAGASILLPFLFHNKKFERNVL